MIRRVLEWLGGSVIVYVLVSACATLDVDGNGLAGSGPDGVGSGAQPNGPGAQPNGPGILNPVPEAEAAEDGSRLVNVYWTTADGLKTPAGYYDKQLGSPCFFSLASDGKFRCIPNLPSAYLSNYFSDAACSVQLASASKTSCEAPVIVTRLAEVEGKCGSDYIYYSLGPAYSGSVYSGTPDNCVLASASTLDTRNFYSVGAEIPPTTYVEGTRIHAE